MMALATALGKGALPNLAVLNLFKNQIGDVGFAALSVALGSGTLPRLQVHGLHSTFAVRSQSVHAAFTHGRNSTSGGTRLGTRA